MIGQWVARFQGNRRRTRWHYVESDIAARVVTRCGREMNRVQRGGELRNHADVAEATILEPQCQDCAG